VPSQLTSFVSDKTLESSYQLNCHFNGDLQRKKLENFVQESFEKYYQVKLSEFYPLLLNLASTNNPDSINAVAGIRCAGEGKLFSEYYLSTRLEDSASRCFKNKLSRQQIVEVGNFAPAGIHYAPALLMAMIGFLYSAGYSCVVFTAVPWVCSIFKRLGLPPLQVSEANSSCLPLDVQQQWGDSYYQHHPKVYMGDLSLGFRTIQKRLTNQHHKFFSLWQHAISSGQNLHSIKAAA
jgi:Thermostable hemolysin